MAVKEQNDSFPEVCVYTSILALDLNLDYRSELIFIFLLQACLKKCFDVDLL